MLHTYFIGFVWSSLSISLWKSCRKVNNVKTGVRKIQAFLRPLGDPLKEFWFERILVKNRVDRAGATKAHEGSFNKEGNKST